MSADPICTPEFAPSAQLAACTEKALYFSSAGRQLFGWLHQPRDVATPGTGLVICKPFGFEAICIHRSVRAFALAIAQRGIPVLRFDYAGTGDSQDLGVDADQVDVWTRDVLAAIEELQRRAGVKQVCLLGVRLGALLATLAASRSAAVKALVAIAPITSGRRYLREIELAIWQANAAAMSVNAPAPAKVPSSLENSGSLESSGFLLSAASVAALSQIDLMAAPAPPVAGALVIDRTDLPGAQAWSNRISKFGIRTDYVSLPDFADMMKAPQFSVIPQQMIGVLCTWLLRSPWLSATEPLSSAQHSAAPTVGSAREVLALGEGAVALTEYPLCFGSDPGLFGILAEPRAGEARRRGVVLLNSGGDYHVGPRRMHVSLARRWAQHGYFVLRMDLGGLGDSATRRGRPDNELFPPAAVEDIRAAVDFLRTHYDIGEITLCGLCSGAYHALRAAVAGLAIQRVLMVNPLKFMPQDARALSELELAEVVSSTHAYAERALTARSWKKVLSGRIDVGRLATVYLRRAWLACESTLREAARRLRIGLPNDLGRQLEQVAARGIKMVFIFARGDTGMELLRMQAGSALQRIESHCRVHILDGADHDFTRIASRVPLENLLTEELYPRRQGAPPALARATQGAVPARVKTTP